MGSYHPHGDMAIYETLVRMAQPFARNVTLVDPQGNFGTLDDPPAAHRYTECRLTAAAMDMVNELDEETVEFRPSYDGDNTEPVCLPAMLPNLLVNGTTGIAVGMATNMPTHNLREVYEAIKLVLTKRRPRPTLDELLAVLPGPDFPTGGIVIDEGLREAYETGRGAIRTRAKAEVVDLQRGRRQGIVVTELPFMVGAERVISRIKELVIDNKIGGIDDVINLSDREHGLRIQIACKPSVNPHAVLADLYRQTPMEDTFGINNVVLVDGVPTTLGLYDLCRHYIDHRLDVIVKRTQFRLRKASDRMHIVEGLLKALDAIDAVIKIIRGSKDSDEAAHAVDDAVEAQRDPGDDDPRHAAAAAHATRKAQASNKSATNYGARLRISTTCCAPRAVNVRRCSPSSASWSSAMASGDAPASSRPRMCPYTRRRPPLPARPSPTNRAW